MKFRLAMGGMPRRVALPLLVVAASLLLAATGFASEGGEGAHHVDRGVQLKDFMWRVIDFALLAAIIWWALKKANLKGSLGERQAGIEKALREAQEAREAAERKLAEYQGRLEQANREIEEIQAAVRKEAKEEQARIIAEAGVMAAKIREQASVTAAQEVAHARAQLREEAARLAVQLAEQTLKGGAMRPEDQDRLVGEYLTKVVELH
jgi:F-type H+-transporting ATPase subunit b